MERPISFFEGVKFPCSLQASATACLRPSSSNMVLKFHSHDLILSMDSRSIFEYEKGLNMDKVEQLQAVDKNQVGMVREVEKLRAELLHAEKRAHAPNPYGGPYMHHPDPLYSSFVLGSGAYAESYGPHSHKGLGAGSVNSSTASGGVGGAPMPTSGGAYDTPLSLR